MNTYFPSEFFALEKFIYKELWKLDAPVWETLSNIENFLSKQVLGKIEVNIPDGVFLENKAQISIGKGTVIEPGSFIKGPCIIGENCTIRQGAYIRGFLITGNECLIGHATEVKNSILLNRVQAAHFAYIGDSILGNEVNLGAGTICANFRLDGKLIPILCGKDSISSGLKKMGAIVGDGVKIGCKVVINPGAILGKETYVLPCLHVQGVIPAHSLVRSINQVSVSKRK
ncbi:MAG: UDP-N-acetylglucosamine diphosphorylase [Chlamydiota bacterium]